MDLVSSISAATKALETLKIMRDIDKQFDAATYKAKIAELMSTVSDLKLALIDAKEAFASQAAELKKQKENFRYAVEETVVVRGKRYEKGKDGNPQGMPFCERCERVEGKLLKLAGTRGKDGYKAKCPECGADYGLEHGYTYRD